MRQGPYLNCSKLSRKSGTYIEHELKRNIVNRPASLQYMKVVFRSVGKRIKDNENRNIRLNRVKKNYLRLKAFHILKKAGLLAVSGAVSTSA